MIGLDDHDRVGWQISVRATTFDLKTNFLHVRMLVLFVGTRDAGPSIALMNVKLQWDKIIGGLVKVTKYTGVFYTCIVSLK